MLGVVAPHAQDFHRGADRVGVLQVSPGTKAGAKAAVATWEGAASWTFCTCTTIDPMAVVEPAAHAFLAAEVPVHAGGHEALEAVGRQDGGVRLALAAQHLHRGEHVGLAAVAAVEGRADVAPVHLAEAVRVDVALDD